MAVQISGEYTGNLNVALHHGPSGNAIHTAAPVDNQGDGSSFSPTDLLAAALGSCMVTTMAIVAQREGIPFAGGKFALEKHMRADPRRVARVPVRVTMPAGLNPEQRAILERAALTCPVYQSLSSEIEKEVEFIY